MVDETVSDIISDASASMIISEALSWIGTPYRHQASCKHAGCDCLGLIRGVYAAFWPEPEQPPTYSPHWAESNSEETLANAAQRYLLPVDRDARAPSNILLFRYKRGFPAKHAGILIDETRFLHAQDGAGGQLVSLSSWWLRHLSYVFAFPPLLNSSQTGIEKK
ncbi:NlpC/P60 family protein [Cohaesibacter marisflavi]|uniref:NlpC/P60 family protein n=1 Tax=Cohaesibacter marisflavi TaxID=655353 RepID=UPI0029C8C6E3|nr:NlpC/P60 family protein [Cohaesibacter marisflavi]